MTVLKIMVGLMVIGFAAVVVGVRAVPARAALQVVEVGSGRVLMQVRVQAGEEFSLSYINPAYGSRVIERFAVGEGGRVRLVKALYEQQAAGTDCSVQCDRLILEGDYWVLESGREIDPLRVLFSAENHAFLAHAGREVALDEFLGPDGTVRVQLTH